jgi:hypothetical protein
MSALSSVHGTHLPLKIAVEDNEQPLVQVKHEPIRPREEAVDLKGPIVDSKEPKRTESQTRREEEKKTSHKANETEQGKETSEKARDKAKSSSEIKKTIIYIEPARAKTNKNPSSGLTKQAEDVKKSGDEKPSQSNESKPKPHDEPKQQPKQEAQKVEIIDKTSKSEAKRTPEIENFAQFEHQMRNLISKKMEEPDTAIQAEPKPAKTADNEPRPEKTGISHSLIG